MRHMHPLLAAVSRLAEEAAGHSSGDEGCEEAWQKLAAIRSICQAGLAGALHALHPIQNMQSSL